MKRKNSIPTLPKTLNKQVENNRIFLLLLDLLSKFIFAEGNGKLISGMDANTLELLCRKVEENRLGSLLYYYCQRDKLLPIFWRNKWSADFRAMSANELCRANELKNIYKILADNNIDAAPLKGAYLAYNYYPHPALRSMSDFDILVRPESIKKAFQLMLDNNFTSDYGVETRIHEPRLSSPRGFIVELHSHIIPDSNRCPADALWKNCTKTEFKGQAISCLSPEISLLHTIDHAFRDHLIGGLKGFVDAAYIFAGANIEQLVNCAEKNGFYDKLILFMNILPDFFPEKYLPATEQVPADLLEDARYLIYNSQHAQSMDKHQLMLYREYNDLNFFKKLLFVKKRLTIQSATIAQMYNCRPDFSMLIYYYFHRAYKYFIELVLFEKRSEQNSFVRDAGICQKKIQCYLNPDIKLNADIK